jgi:hypothetical protein
VVRAAAARATADEQLLVFTELTPLAGNTELSRRLLTPLAVVEMQKGI